MDQRGIGAGRFEVGVLAYPGAHEAAILGMTDLISIANRFAIERGGTQVPVNRWSLDTGGHVRRQDHASDDRLPNVLVIPGRLSGPPSAREAAAFRPWLRYLHEEGTLLATSCAGSFLLAEAGLLDGRAASTHWADADEFRHRFKNVRLEIDEIIIDDGDIITAGGLMAWTDLGMRLCERIFGPQIMMQTSRFMLIDTSGREQRNYKSFEPRTDHGDDAILAVQRMLQAIDGQPVNVLQMSQEAKLEERTFLRRFKSATGFRPIEYLQNLRIEKAKELLQTTRRSVEQVAQAVGYRDMTAFRRLFRKETGLSPVDFRKRFRHRNSQ